MQRPQQTPNAANQARNGLPWGALEQQVVRMQKQISQASQRGDKQAVHALQQQLLEAEAARLLAVRRVSEEAGHSHVSITLGTYAHVLPAQRSEIADRLGALLFTPRAQEAVRP